MLGWHPDSPAALVAPFLMELAVASYRDSVARNPLYIEWLRDYPQFGGPQMAAA